MIYRGEAMAVKYRIEYKNYSKYPKRSVIKKLIPYLLPILLCVAVVLAFLYLNPESNLFTLLLPGKPAVTVQAFDQLTETIRRGGAFAQALEVFCVTIINAK